MKKSLFIGLTCLIAFSWNIFGCASFESTANKGKKVEEERFAPPPDISKRPFKVAEELLESIKKGNYTKAYSYMSAEAKAKVSEDRFSSELKNYMSTASTKSYYVTRYVTNEKVIGSRVALVTVEDKKYPNAPQWKWEFKKTSTGWKANNIDLPPLYEYQKPKKKRRNSH